MAAVPPEPLGLSDARLSDAMRSLQGAIDRFDVEAAQRLGLGRNDWRALRLLVEGGAQPPRAIGHALGLTSGSVTTLIDRLEARGLVRRANDPADRRALTVHALPPARRAVGEAYAPLAAITDRIAQRLGQGRSEAAAKQLRDFARLVEWARVSRPE
ncbi:MarR family transcriptional regulator [Erythrobacter sp.]|uniref:MarR family winged helix-turn-helix transcriptional regulator n=1 Tax=Erythrobacter sp. TaxID=1042 RepID=UPI0025B7C3A8|nr:MarR family transcriptional regulator [Erythrobacter sp.]